MWWFKSCPKCHGDLSGDSDNYGPYISCMQCGHYLSPVEEAILKSSFASLYIRSTEEMRRERLAA